MCSLGNIAEQYAGSQAVIEATSNYYTIYDTLDEYLDNGVEHLLLLGCLTDSMATACQT